MSSMIDEKAQSIIGYDVVVKSKAGEVISGTIWNEDKQAGVIILSSPPTSGTPSLHNVLMLKTSTIQEVISSKPPEKSVESTLPRVDHEKILRREMKAVERMERHLLSRGVGVTERAQQLFDNLSKTMPCKWQGKAIELFDEVLLTEPYTLEECTFKEGCENNETVMERVRNVLDLELQRLDAGTAVADE